MATSREVGPAVTGGAAAPKRRLRRGSFRVGAAIASCCVLLSGCLSTGYTYLSHRNPDGTVVYFKLPADWTRYTYPADLRAANGSLSQSQVSQIQGAKWEITFTGAPRSKPNLFNDLSGRYPQGVAFAVQLNPTQRDTFSIASMRSLILGQDPLGQSSGSPFTILTYNEFTTSGGIRGSKLTTDIAQPKGLTDTYGQIVEVDPQTNWVYALAIGCRASCWGPHESEIDQILNTWNVKELVHG